MWTNQGRENFQEELFDATHLGASDSEAYFRRGRSANYFETMALKISNAFKIPSLWMAEWKEDQHTFHSLAHLSGGEHLPLDLVPIVNWEDHKSTVLKSFFELEDLQKLLPNTGYLEVWKNVPRMGFPFKTAEGNFIGLLVVEDNPESRHRAKNITILGFLSSQISQKLESLQKDNLIARYTKPNDL